MATNAYPVGDAEVSDLEFRRWAGPMSGDGVIPLTANGFEVFGDSSGRQVKVRPGYSYLRGVLFPLLAQLTVALDAGSGQPRVDAIILRLTAEGAPTGDPIVKKGAPAPANPVAPTMTQTSDGTFELLLATVAVPAASSFVVTAAMVTDRRVFVRMGDTQQTVRLRSTTDVSLSSTEHAFQAGPSDGFNMAGDGKRFQARSNGVAAPMWLQPLGGDLTAGKSDHSGTCTLNGKIRLPNTTGVALSSSAHAFQIGPTTGVNLAADGDQIQARNNGVGNALGLNTAGGNVNLGNSASTTNIPGHVNSPNAPWAMAAGAVGAINLIPGGETYVNVAFPTGRFTVPPIVKTEHAPFRDCDSWPTDITKDGFKLYRGNTNVGQRNAVSATWIAVQMTSTTAAG